MQLGEAFSSPLLVRIYDHFRVRTRPKLMPGSDKFVAKLAKIVNFPVKADGQRPRLIPDRLRPPGQIDDAQPPRARGKARRNERPFFIGTPMNDRAQHARKSGSAFAHRVASDNSANAAHARVAPFRSPESHNSLSRSMPQISANVTVVDSLFAILKRRRLGGAFPGQRRSPYRRLLFWGTRSPDRRVRHIFRFLVLIFDSRFSSSAAADSPFSRALLNLFRRVAAPFAAGRTISHRISPNFAVAPHRSSCQTPTCNIGIPYVLGHCGAATLGCVPFACEVH